MLLALPRVISVLSFTTNREKLSIDLVQHINDTYTYLDMKLIMNVPKEKCPEGKITKFLSS